MAGESDKTNDKGDFPWPYVAVTFCINFYVIVRKTRKTRKIWRMPKIVQ